VEAGGSLDRGFAQPEGGQGVHEFVVRKPPPPTNNPPKKTPKNKKRKKKKKPTPSQPQPPKKKPRPKKNPPPKPPQKTPQQPENPPPLKEGFPAAGHAQVLRWSSTKTSLPPEGGSKLKRVTGLSRKAVNKHTRGNNLPEGHYERGTPLFRGFEPLGI